MKKLSFYLSVILLISSANAQNFNDALRLSETESISNARALSMGNAYTALSNDFAGILFNPAGLALVKKLEFSGGMNYNSIKNETAFFNTNSSLSGNSSKLNQFGFVFPFPTKQGSFVLALGYNRVKDFTRSMKFDAFNPNNHSLIQDLAYFNDDVAYELGLSYPTYDNSDNYLGDVTLINGRLNQKGTIKQEGGISNWSFAAAVEIDKDIFLGGTINFYNGDYKRNRDYWEEDIYNNYPSSVLLDPIDPATADFRTFYFNDIIKWDISGFGASIGLLAKVDENINIGVTVKTPTKFNVKEIYLVDGYSHFGNNVEFILDPPIENQYEYDITTPFEFNVGAVYSIDDLTFSADAKIIDYSSIEFTKGFSNLDRERKNNEISDIFKTVVNLHAGVEYYIPRTAIALRGGFMYLPSAFKDDSSDFDKKFATAGIGFTTRNNLTFNLAYAYGWWKDIGDNYDTNLSRTYQDLSRSNLMIGIKYNF